MKTDQEVIDDWLMDGRRFIALEGPDGVGKTYQTQQLAKYFVELGIDTYIACLPHHFRETMFGDKVTEEEKIALSLLDYKLVVEEWLESKADILILDRIAHFSIEVYNLPYVRPEYRRALGLIVQKDFLGGIMPDIVFNLNRPTSFRPPDDSFFEKRNDRNELYERYNNITLQRSNEHIAFNSDIPCIMVYKNWLTEDATPEQVTNFLIERIKVAAQ